MNAVPTDDPMPFRIQGACRDMDLDLFFPVSESIDPRAVAACTGCAVLADCRDWALRHEAHGYWGGLSERARGRLRKALGIELEVAPDPTALPEPEDLAS